ncbi:transmembrane protein 11-A, mitochondrial [Chrysoperla carnea]|uniref:transmembrane protein 11-A, mitochondrial n=1 Tax=Chrysoperla carnea TaxID=189513 RepID=UPI001D076869|nr:transmembrane protein 11-A, mitochondrial [Chrysoperla carnea]
MDGAGDRAELHPSNVALIREVYDSDNAQETFEMELERALDANCMAIIIEPMKLGDETARWITVGNCLHKTAVVSGLSSIFTGLIWQEIPAIYIPLGALSTICTSLYTIGWQFDPCVNYQVETDSRTLARMPILTMLTANTPIVIVRKNQTKRLYLHCGVTLTTIAFCAWRLYKILK